MNTKSDWKEPKLIEAFKSNGYFIVKSEDKIFAAEKNLSLPFTKYKISSNGYSSYLLVFHFELISDAINSATRIANSFRNLGNTYVSSGVNGNILSLVVSTMIDKDFNIHLFDVLKKI